MRERALRLLMAWCLALVSMAAAAVTVRDDVGRGVHLDKPPQRIVSLLPALTEMVCQLGQCRRLVGVDRYSSWPVEVTRLPRMGGGLDPSIEAIVALKPDLVLMAGSARGAERLQALGLTVLQLEPKTHADVQRALDTLAVVLGAPHDSQRLWNAIEGGMAEAARAMPVRSKAWRLYVEVNDAPYAASESSFLGETLSRLGLRNIVPGTLGPFPKINPEMVVRADPDLIVIGERQGDAMSSRPGWRGLRAIREGRVCVFAPEEADILVRPGPRMAEAARLLARCVARHANAAQERRP